MRAIRAWLSCHLLLAIPIYFRAQEHLSEQIENAERAYNEQYIDLGQFAQILDGNAIQRHHESAAQRLRSIEDKARANLLGITIGIAVLFSGFNLAAAGGSATLVPSWVRAPLLILFAIAVCYLLTGGIMALEALRLRPVFIPSLREEATANERTRVIQAVWALEQNEKTALMRTNALSVSFDGIRNGVICLAVAVVLLAIAVALSATESPTPKPADASTPGAHLDSVQPSVPPPTKPARPPVPEQAPALVEESAASTEAVDTLP